MDQCCIYSFGLSETYLTNVLEGFSKEDTKLVHCKNEQQLMSEVSQQECDLILLSHQADSLPDLQLCSKIKKGKKTKRIPVIYSLNRSDSNEVAKIIQAGANDVFTPSCGEEEIHQRITSVVNSHQFLKKLEKKNKEAKKSALEAMEDASSLGRINYFSNESTNCYTLESLANFAFKVLNEFGLSSSIYFHTQSEKKYYSNTGRFSEMEEILLKKFREHALSNTNTTGRFKTFSNRLLIAAPCASLLIRNIPVDESKSGRLRDLLGAFINGLDVRADYIDKHNREIQKMELAQRILATAQKTMAELEQSFNKHEKETVDVMDTLMFSTSEGLMVLGLTDEQESFFLELLEEAMRRLAAIYTSGVTIDKRFDELNKLLSSFTESCVANQSSLQGSDKE